MDTHRLRRVASQASHRRYHSYDSGVASDVDWSRTLNMEQGSCTSLTYTFSDSPHSSAKGDYSTGGSSRSAGSTRRFSQDNNHSDAQLPETNQLPWMDSDVLLVLQNTDTKSSCNMANLSIECLRRFSYLLQRPLIRIAREAQRLSSYTNKCSKEIVESACRLILCKRLYDQCSRYANQAVLLHCLSAAKHTASRSSQCALTLSIGKHFRWMREARIADYIHEFASVYLCSIMEKLIELTFHTAVSKHDLEKPVITTDMLELGIHQSAELYGIYHSTDHLIAGRDFTGSISVPQVAPNKQKVNAALLKAIGSNLTATCVASVAELADIISQGMTHWYSRINSVELVWSSAALRSLYYFMKCCVTDCCDMDLPSISLKSSRDASLLPPLHEWIRLSAAFSQCRADNLITSDDVAQAARILLPNVDCPITPIRSEHGQISLESCEQEMAFSLLSSGRSDMVSHAITLLKKRGINQPNKQGLSPLMLSSLAGDEDTVRLLIQAGANLDTVVVYTPTQPCFTQSCVGWTASCFATAHGHHNTLRLLLDAGCAVEGGAERICKKSGTESPLQIAAAMGHADCANLLLTRGADPFLKAALRSELDSLASDAFTLAAAHGHREMLRKLFSVNRLQCCELLTLAEMLAESVNSDIPRLERLTQERTLAEQAENVYMVIENDYMSIEEIQESGRVGLLYENLSDKLIDSLQISVEIHTMGLPWNLYTWYLTLNTAHVLRRKAIVQSLLNEFSKVNRDSDESHLTEHCLPLMFDIFRDSKNELISQQLASIFSGLFGSQPMPLLKEIRSHPTPAIDSSYINSEHLSDVSFIVEQRRFFAHQIIVVNASAQFKMMLANFAGHSSPEIEINDIDYSTFELLMRYLYGEVNRTLLDGIDQKTARNLLGAAHYFQLDGLQRICEIVLSKALTTENCVSIYKTAKLYQSIELMEICEAFFLQKFTSLLQTSDAFKRTLFSSKSHNRQLLDRLASVLACRLAPKSRIDRQTSTTSIL